MISKSENTMKRKSAIILATVLSAVFALSACGSYPAEKVSGTPDASFAVVGNGGMSVQQDKYVYFVNGYSTEDVTSTNEWGDAVRGGIYRMELADVAGAATQVVTMTADASKYEQSGYAVDPYQGYYGEYKTRLAADVTPVNDGANSVTAFKMHNVENYDEEDVAQIEAKVIAPKKVVDGNGDAVGGGLYIFDGWIYYTSPVTEKNSTGEILYKRVEFLRTRLNGKDTQMIYKSTSDDVKPNYGYYYYNGKTYLTVLDDGSLYSFVCSDKNVVSVAKDRGKTAPIATDVTSAVFADKPVWNKNMPTGGMEDFVYYTRAVVTEDNEPQGNVVERIRPNGEMKTQLFNDGTTVSLLKLSNGYLYYTAQDVYGATTLIANDLAGYPLTKDGEVTASNDKVELADMATLTDAFVGSDIVSYADGKVSVGHYILATQNGDFVRITAAGTTKLVSGITAKVQFVEDGYAYYFATAASTSSPFTTFYRVSLAGGDQIKIADQNALYAPNGFFAPEVTAGYLFYVSDLVETVMVEDTAAKAPKTTDAGYVLVKRAAANDNEPEFFAGVFEKADIPEADDEEEV